MTIAPVTTPTHTAIPFIRELYETAFPLHERRTAEQLLAIIGTPAMQLELIEDDNEMIGFVIWWIIEAYHYIEHIAINPLHRGKQYGSKIIEQLKEMSGNKLILEVEHPDEEDAKRRIEFYKRLELQVIPFTYYQPAYRKGEPANPMLLMSIPTITEKKLFDSIALQISQIVYEQFY